MGGNKAADKPGKDQEGQAGQAGQPEQAVQAGQTDQAVQKGQTGGGSAFGGFLSYFYGNFVVLLLGFIQTPIVTRLMSNDEYGRTGMFETAVSCIYIFAIFGMDQAYIRFYYRRGVDRRALMRKCLIPALSIVSVLSVIYLFSASLVNDFLFKRGGADITALVAAYTLISVFERFLFLDVRMQQNGRLYSNINIAQKVINILLIIVFFHLLGNDFRVVLYAMTLSWGSTTLFLAVRYLLSGRDGMKAGKGDDERDYVQVSAGELFHYGAPFILVLLMEWLLSSCDRLALKQWAGYGQLGIYTAAMKIMVLLITFKNTFVAYWSPVAMEKYENSRTEEARAFFRRAFDITRLCCMFLAVGLIAMRGVVVLLLGRDYRGAENIIPFLTLMPIFAMMFEITVQGVKFKKRSILLNFASFAAIICNIAGNAYLVPVFQGTGAAMATGISYIAWFWAGSLISERVYPVGYDYAKTALEAVILILLCAGCSFVEGWAFSSLSCFAALVFICLLERENLVYIWVLAAGRLRKRAG